VAYLLMRGWLDSFDQRIALNPSYFLLATGLALLVALLTVTAHAVKAARSDPSQALRYE
jgi:putative ABC transport system permease protein